MMTDYNRRTWKVRQMTGLLLAREVLPQAEPSTFGRGQENLSENVRFPFREVLRPLVGVLHWFFQCADYGDYSR